MKDYFFSSFINLSLVGGESCAHICTYLLAFNFILDTACFVIKGVQAKTSPVEISASKMAIYSILVNFCVSNVNANIPGEK